MTVEERLWQLVLRLKQKTAEGSVPWEATPGKATFQTSLPKFSVRIAEIPGEGEVDYEIRVYEEGGRLLERASDVEISKAMEGISGQESFKTMKELYTMARRRAFGVEEALDELLASLDESGA
jgi:hypothetical protein